MKRKKRQQKRPRPAIALRAEDKALLDSLLKDWRTEPPEKTVHRISTPEMAHAFVERLPEDVMTSMPVLQCVHDAFEQKDVRKAVRRKVFRLKEKGVEVPILVSDNPSPSFTLKSPQQEKAQAYVGPIDGTGSRGVFVCIPRLPSGYDVGIGLVSDETGMMQFQGTTTSKKRMKELKVHLMEEMGIDIPTSVSHAVTILENAYEKSLGDSLQIPSDYLPLRSRILSHGTVLAHPPVYDVESEIPDPEQVLTPSRLQKLFDHPAMRTWIIRPDEMESLLEILQESEEGPILLSDVQKKERIQSIKEKWLEEHFPASRLNLLVSRFEEMAYVFHGLGEIQYARLALSAAVAVRKKDAFQPISPLLEFFLERSMALYDDLAPEGKERDQIVANASRSPHSIILP